MLALKECKLWNLGDECCEKHSVGVISDSAAVSVGSIERSAMDLAGRRRGGDGIIDRESASGVGVLEALRSVRR